MRRAAVLMVATALAVVLAGCSVPAPQVPAALPPPVDTECVAGLRFVDAYSAVAGRYDPKLADDRARLAATTSMGAARSLLSEIASLLDSYATDLSGLPAPVDLAAALAAAISTNRALSVASLKLRDSAFGGSDQSAFQAQAAQRSAAAHQLALQVEFVSSECR